MQGLYIHIPFCAQACHYCDFHFSTSMKFRSRMVDALCKEMELRVPYLKSKKYNTVYLGGGTPSVLHSNELDRIFDTMHRLFFIEADAEITLEANPDDLTPEMLYVFKSIGINRLSIGVQSFDDGHLKFLHRIHSSGESIAAIERAQQAGFENITIDLIYGIHSPDHSIWIKDLDKALSLGIPHISSYCLTIEPDTVFGRRIKQKTLSEVEDAFAAEQFEILVDAMTKAGMEQYEISNFSLPGRFSQHNSSYWRGSHYLGIGPSAHSFDGTSRQFNVANNQEYMKSVEQNEIPYEKEILTPTDFFNELLLTGLRTKWGFDLEKLEQESRVPAGFNRNKLHHYLEKGYIMSEGGVLTLSERGKLIADRITGDLFVV